MVPRSGGAILLPGAKHLCGLFPGAYNYPRLAHRVFSSVGERFLHTEEVTGSKPVTPTSLDEIAGSAGFSLIFVNARIGLSYGWFRHRPPSWTAFFV